MAGILAEVGGSARLVWEGMRRLVTTSPSEVWEEQGGNGAVVACSRLIEEAPLEDVDGCVVAVDGRISRHTAAESCACVREAYLRWGTELMPRVEGPLAFVLWDVRRRRLLAGSDVMGRRSLAYERLSGGLVVSTRILAIAARAGLPRPWDLEYMAHALSAISSQKPELTPFAGVHRVPPGWVLLFEGGRASLCEGDRLGSWRLSSRSDWELEASLKQAIDAALEVHGPLQPRACIALSGGIDSSTLAARLSPLRVTPAFSLVSTDRPELDEHIAIDAVQDSFPRLTVRRMSIEDAPRLEELIVPDDPEELAPAFREARASLYERAAASGFTTIITGEGGDEVFDLCVASRDLVSEGQGGGARASIASLRAFGSLALRGSVVPAWTLRLWRARERGSVRWPPWMRPSFCTSPEAVAALDEWMRRAALTSFRPRLDALLRSAAVVGSLASERLLARRYGLELEWPLLERELAELTVAATARQRLGGGGEQKALLRQVARASGVPRLVTASPKEHRLYDAKVERDLERAERVLTETIARAKMTLVVDARGLTGASPNMPSSIEAKYARLAATRTLRWMAAVERELGWEAGASGPGNP